jgi:hypothetical protein
MTSGFRREANENCALLSFTQRVMVIPYRRLETTYASHFQTSRILEDGTDWFSRNVSKELPLHAV